MLGAILGGIGSIASSFLGKSAADQQADNQIKFAKNAIQWKVADAKKAGIHPLYALGANTTSYSPVSVGQPDLGAMGQDIGSAIERVSNPQEKASGALAGLALERAGLENDLLRAQIARARINVAGQVPMARMLSVGGMGIAPNPSDSPASEWENEFGEAADVIGAGRLVNEVSKQVPGKADKFITDSLLKPGWRDRGIVPGSFADRILRLFEARSSGW